MVTSSVIGSFICPFWIYILLSDFYIVQYDEVKQWWGIFSFGKSAPNISLLKYDFQAKFLRDTSPQIKESAFFVS